MDEFFHVSQCKSAKEMWEVLEVTHEGTNDVKRARKHALIQDETRRIHSGCAKEIHSHSQPSHRLG